GQIVGSAAAEAVEVTAGRGLSCPNICRGPSRVKRRKHRRLALRQNVLNETEPLLAVRKTQTCPRAPALVFFLYASRSRPRAISADFRFQTPRGSTPSHRQARARACKKLPQPSASWRDRLGEDLYDGQCCCEGI